MSVYIYNVTIEFPMAVEADSRGEADELAKVHAPGDFHEWCLEAIMRTPELGHLVKRHDDIPEDMRDMEPWGHRGPHRTLGEMFPKVD